MPDEGSAFDGRSDAQKIAFGPLIFQAARMLRDMGILACLADNHRTGVTQSEIARRTELSNYAVGVLIDNGLAAGLVSERDERYFITKTGHFILHDPMTRANMNFVNDVCYRGMSRLEEALRESKPAGLSLLGPWSTVYEALPELPDDVRRSWYEFDHLYSDAAFDQCLPVVFEGKPARMLDVGGNTGRWALRCLRHSPDVHVRIMDLPAQVEGAVTALHAQGFSDRVHGHPIDLLDRSGEFPGGHDVIWMSQLLDCFGEEDIVSILSRARAVMDENTRLFILEPFLDRQRHDAAALCLAATSLYFACMANGAGRMYRCADLIRLAEHAGLRIAGEFDEMGLAHTLLECRAGT